MHIAKVTEVVHFSLPFFYRYGRGGSSSLMELLAVQEGLHRLAAEKTIQVSTDSRFVIRGLVQWVHFCKHNSWQTAHGRAVRYAQHWQQTSALCRGKCIEFRWVKGHAGDMDQEFCHRLARAAVTTPWQC
jgi:ribonuclease HI